MNTLRFMKIIIIKKNMKEHLIDKYSQEKFFKSKRKKMIMAHHAFFSVILDQKTFTPTRFLRNMGFLILRKKTNILKIIENFL